MALRPGIETHTTWLRWTRRVVGSAAGRGRHRHRARDSVQCKPRLFSSTRRRVPSTHTQPRIRPQGKLRRHRGPACGSRWLRWASPCPSVPGTARTTFPTGWRSSTRGRRLPAIPATAICMRMACAGCSARCCSPSRKRPSSCTTTRPGFFRRPYLARRRPCAVGRRILDHQVLSRADVDAADVRRRRHTFRPLDRPGNRSLRPTQGPARDQPGQRAEAGSRWSAVSTRSRVAGRAGGAGGPSVMAMSRSRMMNAFSRSAADVCQSRHSARSAVKPLSRSATNQAAARSTPRALSQRRRARSR